MLNNNGFRRLADVAVRTENLKTNLQAEESYSVWGNNSRIVRLANARFLLAAKSTKRANSPATWPSVRQRMIKRAGSEELGRREHLLIEDIFKLSCGFFRTNWRKMCIRKCKLKTFAASMTYRIRKHRVPLRILVQFPRSRPAKAASALVSLRFT